MSQVTKVVVPTEEGCTPYYVVSPWNDAVPPLRFPQDESGPRIGQATTVLAWRHKDDPRVVRWPSRAVRSQELFNKNSPWLRLLQGPGSTFIVTRHTSPNPQDAREAASMIRYEENLKRFLTHRNVVACRVAAAPYAVTEDQRTIAVLRENLEIAERIRDRNMKLFLQAETKARDAITKRMHVEGLLNEMIATNSALRSRIRSAELAESVVEGIRKALRP